MCNNWGARGTVCESIESGGYPWICFFMSSIVCGKKMPARILMVNEVNKVRRSSYVLDSDLF